MRIMPTLLVTGVLVVGIDACGGSGPGSKSSSSASAHGPTGTAADASATTEVIPLRLLNSKATKSFRKDPDVDTGIPNGDVGYHDRDDGRILGYYGHLADPVDVRAVTAVTRRYLAVAASGNGRKACALLVPGTAYAAPNDYGRHGPPYMRSAKTCPEVLARIFQHHRPGVESKIVVTGVLTNGERAYALVGSPQIPASFMRLVREKNGWRMESVIYGAII